jgi:hypothetical protein
MSDDDGTPHAERFECFSQQTGLPLRRPHRAKRPVAIPKTRAVKCDDSTLPPSREIEQPAQCEIIGRDDIAVEKEDGPTLASLEVVKRHTVDGDVPTAGRMLLLYLARSIGVPQRHRCHGGHGTRQDHAVSRPICQRGAQ